MMSHDLGYDPDTHREPRPREMYGEESWERGDRVAMAGTDLYGTILQGPPFAVEPPVSVLVRWDTITPEEGDRSWISTLDLVLIAVPR